jgi:hypothetical protein
MSAANDGTDTETRITAAVKSLIFITVLVARQVVVISSQPGRTLHCLRIASTANLNQPDFPLSAARLAGQISPWMRREPWRW